MQEYVTRIRDFNRFYTNVIGLLDNHVYDSEFTLPEARVLYELYYSKVHTARALMELIDIDKGYLSRLLLSFERRKLIRRVRSKEDGRSALISLTDHGIKSFVELDKASERQATAWLKQLTATKRKELVSHMSAIKTIIQSVLGK
jgi:DNA-binding MarR family transcriptional regulator